MTVDRFTKNIMGAIREAKSEDELRDVLGRFADGLGFDKFIFGCLLPTSYVNPKVVVLNGYPADWRAHYEKQRYLGCDPTVIHCLKNLTPVIWDDMVFGDKKSAPARVMSEASDFGICSGVSLPIHGTGSDWGMLSLATGAGHSRTRSKITKGLPCAQALLPYVYEKVLDFEKAADKNLTVSLTNREKECLLWTADGKTSWEISQILKVSERTVIFHLQNVTRKLSVTNRPHAVARALTFSLIDPDL